MGVEAFEKVSAAGLKPQAESWSPFGFGARPGGLQANIW
jgi:hypothetical protein